MFMGVVFMLLVGAVLFLTFRVNTLQTASRLTNEKYRDDVKQISRLVLQSTTQSNPVIKLEDSIRAEVLMERLQNHPAGTQKLCTMLQLDRNEIDDLRVAVATQKQVSLDIFMKELLAAHPELDLRLLNRLSGYTSETTGPTTASPSAPSSGANNQTSRAALVQA